MRLLSIEIENFLSIEHLTYNFVNHPLLIQGVNLTDEDQDSNGSGKSAFQAAILYALSALNSRKTTDSGLIRWGSTKAKVELKVRCDQRGETLLIQRELTKSGSKLFLYKYRETLNEERDGVDFSTVRDGNNYILEWLDMGKEDLTSYYIISNERFKSFFSSSNTDNIQLISRIAGTEVLDGVDNEVKTDIQEITDKISESGKKQSKIEGFIESYEEQIEELKSFDHKKQKAQAIKDLTDEIEELEQDIEPLTDSIAGYDSKISGLTKELEENVSQLTDLEENIPNVEDDEADLLLLRRERVESKTSLQTIKARLKGLITCPNCGFEFVEDSETTAEEYYDEEATLEALIPELDSAIEALEESIQESDEAKKVLRKLKNEIFQVESSIDSYRKKKVKAEREISNIEGTIVRKRDEIKLVTDEVAPNKVSEIKSLEGKIKEQEQKLEEEKRICQSLEVQLSETEEWITNFKRFKNYLANKSLLSIQVRCNNYLQKMKSNLRVLIEGFKELANGKEKEEITAYVVREGKSSFRSYSGGERARLQVAMILAIQELINTTNKYGGLQFLITDEIFEGVDASGINFIMKSMKDLSTCVMVTTHVVDDKTDVEKLVFEKVNGVTKIKE